MYAVSCKKIVLPNGLTVLFHRKTQAPIFSACILSRVGSVNEGPGLTGISHFLEHLMFKGTRLMGILDSDTEAPILERIDALAEERLKEQAKLRTCYGGGSEERVKELTIAISELEKELKPLNVPNEMWTIYQRHGGINLNAGTGCDGTQYYVTLPKNKFELWAFIESDRLKNAVFREFYSERDVVQEERRLRNDNDPDGALREQFNALISLGSPYSNPIVGWPNDLNTLTRAEVKRYFEEYYAPSNLVVSLVGDVDEEVFLSSIESYFGSIPARKYPPIRFADRGVQRGERRVEVKFNAQPRELIGYPGPPPGHPDQYALDMACGILSEGRNSRFYRHIVEKGFAFRAWIGVCTRAWSNDILISLQPQQPHKMSEVEDELYREIADLRDNGPSEREMERIATRVRVNCLEELESSTGLASALAEAEAFRGGWEQFDDCQKYLEVTGEDVKRVLKEYIRPDMRTVAELIPIAEDICQNDKEMEGK